MKAVGGFLPVVLHHAAVDPMPPVEAEPDIVSADHRKVVDRAESHGILAVVHPHVGTMSGSTAAVRRLAEQTGVQFCLDIGHPLVGGTNPLEIVRDHADRVGVAHLKDVRAELATRGKVRASIDFLPGL